MKKVYFFGLLFISLLAHSQNFDSFASGIRINNTIYNTTGTGLNQINPNTGAQNFEAANLGSFGQNSSCARITAGEVKTWKTASGNVCSVILNWRVYLSSATPSGSFTAIPLSVVTDCDLGTNTFFDGFGPCTSGDQKWKNYTANDNFISSLLPGNYTLEIYYEFTGSDATSSTCETTKYISNFGANFKANFSISNPISNPTVSATSICEGDILTLTANPSNGVAPYTYAWTGPNGYTSATENPTITTTLSNTGIYSLVVTDACGAVSTIQNTQSVTVNPKIDPEFEGINPGLCRFGTAPLLPNLSSNGITGTWNPTTVNNSVVGTFFYTFTPDAGQCANNFVQTIFVVNNVVPSFTLPASICFGATPPNLNTTSNNGIIGTWNPSTVSNTATGTYTFTPNAGQCATTRTVTITVNPNVTPTFTLPSTICQGAIVPTLPTTSNNGITGTWNPSTVSNTTTGTYIFTHTAGQCSTDVTITITVNPNITPTFNAIAPICENAAVPTLPTTSTNGITGTWNPATVSNTASGTYTFTPTTGLCATTTTLNITVVPNVTPTFDPIPNVCYQSVAPTLPTTSTNEITGTWNPATVSNTTSGTYTFTPTSGLCALPISINIIVDSINPTFDAVAPICAGATAPILPPTSTNGITGTWNPTTVSNTNSGTYTFTPDANQCATTASINVIVTPNETPTFNSIAPICEGETAPILQTTSNNGITGIWNPATVSNTNSDTYTFTPDGNQCATTATLNVIVNPNITPTFDVIAPICEGTTAPILPTTSTNGITGTWNPATVSNTASGTYTFTPTSGVCVLTTTINVIVNPNVTPTFNDIAPICEGTTAPILPPTSTNGITGTWNPATVSNTNSGTYTFTPDANQCATTATLNIVVTPNTIPTFDAIAPICEGETAPILQTTSNNGITGTWNPDIVSNTNSDTYTFTPDGNQCATTTTLNVIVNPNITPTFTIADSICDGATAPILPTTSTNGITGTWNPATVSNTTSGTYTFTPTNGVCVLTTTINIIVNPIVTPTFDPIPNVCYQSVAPTLPPTSTNGISGTWNPAIISNTTSGTYTFTPNSGECGTTTTLSVIVDTINPNFNDIAPICEGTTAPILPPTSTNGITGTWNPAIVSNTTSAIYTFTPDANQCATTATINIVVTPNEIPTFDAIAPICEGQTAPILPTTSTNGITGTWNPETVSNTNSDTYTFTPDGNQCATTATLNVTVNPNLVPTFAPIAPICENATVPTLPTTSTNGITGSWNPETINNTTSGTYTFTPTAGLCALPTSIDVIINPNLTPTFDAIPSICEGQLAPILPLLSNNGISGTWNPAIVSNTTSGTYTFTPDSNQCATTTSLEIIVIPNVIPTFDAIADVCYQSTAPTLPTTSTNGITGTWNPATVSNTTSGTYTFTPDGNQCATTATLNINVNIITPTFNSIADVCYGTTPPTLPLTSNNGINGTWNPATVSNTTSGTYTFTPDENQCAIATSLTINVTTITPTFDAIADVCYGTTAPILSTTSTNGINGTWNPATVSNTTSGIYTFTPDANQCAIETSLTINVTTVIPTFDTIASICEGATAPILPTTSTNGITGTWNPETVSNTTSGTYTFIPNANQCATTTSLEVIVNPNITPIFDAVADVCYQSTLPTLPLTSNNGITGTWNPATVSNTTSGTYTFTPDGNQCATTATLNINVTTITPTFDAIADVCYNTTAPTLQLVSTNGISGTWNPATISNTTSGTYTFTPDANQCAIETSLNVTVTTINPTFDAIAPICENATAPTLSLTSTNGITGTWNPATISNTTSGTYTFTPDANQCATTTSLDVIVNPIVTPTFAAIADVCYNTTAPTLQLISTNGITGTWNPTVISNTTSGTYTFTPDANQCAIETTLTVNVTTVNPVFDAIAPICDGATAPILASISNNGITGTWNPATVSNTTSGTYTFTPDANQCATETSLTVTVTPNEIPTFNAIADVCYNTTAPTLPATSTNGITGTWNPATISNTTSGTYTFTPDANQCAVTATLSVTITTINPVFTPIADVCYGSTAPTLPLTSDNGITGTWNPATIDNTTAGTYSFTPDANQCATTATLSVNINTIIPTFTPIADVCYGSTAPTLPLTSDNGINGTWNPTIISNTTAGTYTFTPDANQCATTATISVNVNTITPTFMPFANVCFGTTAPTLPLTSNNGITGTWNPTTIDNTTSGSYIFTPDANQCAITTTIAVTITPLITPVFNAISPICENAVAPILPTISTNGITGTWNSLVSNTTTGTYTFTPDANQCATTATITVTVTPNVTPTFTAIAPICSGTASPVLSLLSNNGFSGTWNPATIDNSASGTYTFTPNAGQCATATTLSVIVYASPTDLDITTNSVFNQTSNGELTINGVTSGVSPFTYSINNGTFTSNTSYTDLAPGDYVVTVRDSNGCEYEETVTITSTCIFPKGISPNDDGLNDTFNLNDCNVVRLELFNRYGTKVNSFNNYTSQWDGTTADGKTLPDGTYFYSAELNNGTSKTGWVYISR